MILPAGKFLLRFLGGIVAAILLGGALLAWSISRGPVQLSVLTPYIADALAGAVEGITAEVGRTELAWNEEDRSLDLRARDVVLRDERGEVAARVPDMTVGVALNDLLRGRLAVNAVDVRGVELRINRSTDGALDFGLSMRVRDRTGEDGAVGSGFEALAERLAGQAGRDTAIGLRRVRVTSADISLFDEGTGVLWRAPDSELALNRDAGVIRADLDLKVELGERPLRVTGQGRFAPEDGTTNLVFTFSGLQPEELADRVPSLAELAALRVPLAGRIAFVLGPDRQPGPISLVVTGGSGQIVAPQMWDAPLPISEMLVEGLFDTQAVSIRLDRFLVGADGLLITGNGNWAQADDRLRVEAAFSNLAVNRLGRYWPAVLAKEAREWVLLNVRNGVVPQAGFRMDTPLAPLLAGADPPAGSLRLEFSVTGTDVNYLRPMPALTGVSGRAVLGATRIDMDVGAGVAGGVNLTGGRVSVTGFNERRQPARIAFDAHGQVATILRLIDSDPLRLIRPLGLDLAAVGGDARLKVELDLPLEAQVRLDDVTVNVTAAATDVAAPTPIRGLELSGGAFTLRATKNGLSAEGRGRLGAAPADISWTEDFTGRQHERSRYRVKGTFSDAERRALGDVEQVRLSGPVDAELTITQLRTGILDVDAKLDLAAADLELPDMHWRKPAGTSGTATASVRQLADRTWQVERGTLDTADLRGRFSLAIRDAALLRLDVAELKFGENDVTVSVAPDTSGQLVVEARGKRSDLRPWLQDAASSPNAGAGDGSGQRVLVRLAIDEAVMGEELRLESLAGRLSLQGGVLRGVDLGGRLGTDGTMVFRVEPKGAGRRLVLSASDAGPITAWIGAPNLRGGTFMLDATIADDQPGQPMKGLLLLEKFNLVNAPLFARLLSIASLTGIADLLSGDGIGFTRASVPFTMVGDVISIEGAQAHGSAMGFTAEGQLNRKTDALGLHGTLVPAYTLNSLLGNIPLVGGLLVGRQGEGVFGITWRINGTVNEPEVLVNPLSVLAPGFLRRLFELPDGTTSERDPNAAPPQQR